MAELRILTWNILGRKKPDLNVVGNFIAAQSPGVACMQEVLATQAAPISRIGHLETKKWSFKHWPLRANPEGLAIMSSYPVDNFDSEVISEGERFWSPHRRIMQSAIITAEDTQILVINTHLSSTDRAARAAQVKKILDGIDELAMTPHVVIAGDLNMTPDDQILNLFRDRDMVECWTTPEQPMTNWDGTDRTGPPHQRLDYIWVSDGLDVKEATIPSFGESGFGDLAMNSDHLPVTTTLQW